ncbi:MAG TPA: hypothetical protein VMR97_01410 [Acidimicrobiales bacterium]|nr:hypothetical protein [Acidimicrobiales bacterium]
MAETRKWFDSSQPQTLQGAVMLCYITAAFGLIGILLGGYSLFGLVPLAIGVAGFGVANERRWGYGLGVVLAVLNVLGDTAIMLLGAFSFVITLLFAVVLLALLLHPQSRAYQRIWFH